MQKRFWFVLFVVSSAFWSCNNDDDFPGSDRNFYSGAYTAATDNDLLGTWAITRLEFFGQMVNVPVVYPKCGRDYMEFADNHVYNEYLFQDSSCNFMEQSLNWSVRDGVITLTNTLGQFDEMVLTKVSASELVLKTRLDVDEDGELDIVTAYLTRYKPKIIDKVSDSFFRNLDEAHAHLLSFKWDAYNDSQSFVAYEIYRTTGTNESKDNAVLVQTITDRQVTTFTDLEPPAENGLGYFIRIKLTTGILGESRLHIVNTDMLVVLPVNMKEPTVVGNSIVLEWEESTMPYFSHYELSYSNFPYNMTGHGKQEIKVVDVFEKNTVSYTDEQAPYLKNPVYSIRVYDIFGNYSLLNPTAFKTTWEVPFEREGLLPLEGIMSYATDPSEPVIYFHGHPEDTFPFKLYRYNYETEEMLSVTDVVSNISEYSAIEVVNTSYGKELFIGYNHKLDVYDANTLDFKYAIAVDGLVGMDDFVTTGSDYWVMTDSNAIYSFLRTNDQLSLVDSKPHFSNFHGSYAYNVFEIETNRFLVGHRREGSSKLYSLQSDGQLIYEQEVAIPILDYGKRLSKASKPGQVLVNFEERQLFSTVSFLSLGVFSQPFHAMNLSTDGQFIFGTNNDPEWPIQKDSAHAKEAVIYNRTTQQVQVIPTTGYPLAVFQNHKGDVLCVSSGLKKSKLEESLFSTIDFFMEKLDVQLP